MKADIPLAERQRREAEEGRELRAALVRRHVQVLGEDAAIQAALMARNIERGPAFAAALARNARG
jgi:hypothetical protein